MKPYHRAGPQTHKNDDQGGGAKSARHCCSSISYGVSVGGKKVNHLPRYGTRTFRGKY